MLVITFKREQSTIIEKTPTNVMVAHCGVMRQGLGREQGGECGGGRGSRGGRGGGAGGRGMVGGCVAAEKDLS